MQEKEGEDEIDGVSWKGLCSEEKGTSSRRSGPSLQFWCLGPQFVGLSVALKKNVYKGCAGN